ncbi:probable disease resistance protein At1g61300 [Cryptomeria japonica]|uniref:probable disease resistance protein At1g61300 n=1 Tax=Cryptomeria japonica TaxID=3369 RepID=UPI0027D9DA28|nr:probable disease resistance protein At1g61300 [Cryptomeria japonica]
MGDPGFIPGMIGYTIHLAVSQVIQYINVAIRCRKELDALKALLLKIKEMNMEMQQCRKALQSGRMSTSFELPLPFAVNSWLNELNSLLDEASDLVTHCNVQSYWHLFPRYRTSRKIRRLIENVEKHLASTPSIAFLHQLQQNVTNQQVLEQIRGRMDSLNLYTSALTGTFGDLFPSNSSAASNTKYIEEALIVGQDSSFTRLLDLIHSEQHKNVSRFGLVGKGGAGKTLLLKRVFNCDQVQSLFCNDLILWLTVSQTPSFNALRNALFKQIALKVNQRPDSTHEDHMKTWLNESMRKHKFALFLDDVWETSATSLLEELCVPHSPLHDSNIIIATSRSRSVLSQLGVPTPSIIQMQDLTEDDSWRLFSFHAFPHRDGILPISIDQEIARRVCKECGGLPLAIKVVGQAMAGISESNEWEFALQRLQNDVTHSLSSTLRLSYNALANLPGYGISLQLCFLCLAAFSEDEVIHYEIAIKYWIGEGLVVGPDPLQIGEIYIRLLADRCLIEPIHKDQDRKVINFRVHDVLHHFLAHQIAKKEEKCFFQAHKGLGEFPADDCGGHIRISLRDNNLTKVPKAFGAPYIRSLLLAGNTTLKEIPKEVIGSMTTLRVLDLSRTALQSLPKNVGCLKHLVCLILCSMPIKKLPYSIGTLRKLQILDLYQSEITELPSSISKLTSLQLLNVPSCQDLQCMPSGISNLRSLKYLNTGGSRNIGWNKCRRGRLSLNDLGTLNQLKRLGLTNNGEIIREGTLGSMKQIEALLLDLTDMEKLPSDMNAISKLRKLWLVCPHLLQIEDSFCEFQNLGYISLFNCGMLKQLPPLQKLENLKHLQIVACRNIEKLPEEFGKEGAFPKLEVFSVVAMQKLEQLPIVKEGAMPSLKTLTIMKCEALQRIPECYWDLKSVEKIRVYGCSNVQLVMAEEEHFIKTKSQVQTVTLSTTETETLEKRYNNILCQSEHIYYGEFWCSEMFQFVDEINRYLSLYDLCPNNGIQQKFNTSICTSIVTPIAGYTLDNILEVT